MDRKLNIEFKHLTFPIEVGYILKSRKRFDFILGLGLETSYLKSHDDNYLDIINELIGIRYEGRYNDLRFAPLLSMSINSNARNKNILGIRLYAKRDLSRFIGEGTGWGFLGNLAPARNLQLGVGVQYFVSLGKRPIAEEWFPAAI